jgi:hypothetical protein
MIPVLKGHLTFLSNFGEGTESVVGDGEVGWTGVAVGAGVGELDSTLSESGIPRSIGFRGVVHLENRGSIPNSNLASRSNEIALDVSASRGFYPKGGICER